MKSEITKEEARRSDVQNPSVAQALEAPRLTDKRLKQRHESRVTDRIQGVTGLPKALPSPRQGATSTFSHTQGWRSGPVMGCGHDTTAPARAGMVLKAGGIRASAHIKE